MTTDDVDTVASGPGPVTNGPSGNGDHGSDGPPVPPVRRTPSLRPALVVLGIATGLVVIFGVLAVVSSPGTNNTPRSSGPTRVKGTPLVAVAAARSLKPIEQPGTPPANIIDALTLPRGAVARGHQDNSAAGTQYDEQMGFSVHASEAAVIAFYKAELKAHGWGEFDVGSVPDQPGATEVLAQQGGTDGWYWEVGAVVSPTTFGGAGGSVESTPFTLRLFQEPDDD